MAAGRSFLAVRPSEVKDRKGMRLVAPLQNTKRYVADPHHGFRLGTKRTMVRVSMNRQCRFVALQGALEPGAAEKRKDRFRFTDDSFFDRGIERHRSEA
jgi:hypothetical protein